MKILSKIHLHIQSYLSEKIWFSFESPCLSCQVMSLLDLHCRYIQKATQGKTMRPPPPKPRMLNIFLESSPIVCCLLLLVMALGTVVLVFVRCFFLGTSVLVIVLLGSVVLGLNITDIISAFCWQVTLTVESRSSPISFQYICHSCWLSGQVLLGSQSISEAKNSKFVVGRFLLEPRVVFCSSSILFKSSPLFCLVVIIILKQQSPLQERGERRRLNASKGKRKGLTISPQPLGKNWNRFYSGRKRSLQLEGRTETENFFRFKFLIKYMKDVHIFQIWDAMSI